MSLLKKELKRERELNIPSMNLWKSTNKEIREMKYPKVQYELDLNAKYACRFFEKNGFAYEIKRQSYEGDTFELKKDGITFSVKVPSNPKLNKKKYFEQLVQYFENVKDCEDFKKLYYDLFGNKESEEK